jgi:hypothetical protein
VLRRVISLAWAPQLRAKFSAFRVGERVERADQFRALHLCGEDAFTMCPRKGKSNPLSVTDNIEGVTGSSRHSSTNTMVQSMAAHVSGVMG